MSVIKPFVSKVKLEEILEPGMTEVALGSPEYRSDVAKFELRLVKRWLSLVPHLVKVIEWFDAPIGSNFGNGEYLLSDDTATSHRWKIESKYEAIPNNYNVDPAKRAKRERDREQDIGRQIFAFEALIESIAQHGVINPLLVTPTGDIVDGTMTYLVLKSQGVEDKDIPYLVMDDLTDEQSCKTFMRKMKLGRTNLTEQDRRRLIVDEVIDDANRPEKEHWTSRRMAQKLGVSHVTIEKTRKEQEREGLIGPIRFVLAEDGRLYTRTPATKADPDYLADQKKQEEESKKRENKAKEDRLNQVVKDQPLLQPFVQALNNPDGLKRAKAALEEKDPPIALTASGELAKVKLTGTGFTVATESKEDVLKEGVHLHHIGRGKVVVDVRDKAVLIVPEDLKAAAK